MNNLPIDVWGRILVFIDLKERVQVCTLLINYGLVKIESCMVNTYMILLEQALSNDIKLRSNELEHYDYEPMYL